MPEYIERETVLQTLNENKIPYNVDVNYFITNAPAVDVVEVVRCKNCKYWFSPSNDDAHYCKYKYGLQGLVAEEDYCSYGERRLKNE